MEIFANHGNVIDQEVDAAVVNLFESVAVPAGATGAVDRALGGLLSRLISSGEITGKIGETTLIHTPTQAYPDFKPQKVLVVGLGKSESFGINEVRKVSAVMVQRLRESFVRTACTIVHGAGLGGLDAGHAAEAVVEGALGGGYRFLRYKSRQENVPPSLDSLSIIERDTAKMNVLRDAVERGRVYAEARNLARDLVNEPANHLSPLEMAEVARRAAIEHSFLCETMDRYECEKMNMGAFLSVAKGSAQPPQFIHLTYEGDTQNPDNNIWFIGKSITFDTGGISLKPASGMWEMKGDMAGGAAVIGAMTAVARLKPAVNVHAVCLATENMPGGAAQRPGDVVRAMNGLWIEVDNTDAEGRLTLADGVAYANSKGARKIVDIATLTGAMRIALGRGHIGAFSNNNALFDLVKKAGDSRGETVWRMPLDGLSKKQNASSVADIKNTGGRYGGAITAAHFISEFVDETPWVHLDIAGVSMSDKNEGEVVQGATGKGARLLAQLAVDCAEERKA